MINSYTICKERCITQKTNLKAVDKINTSMQSTQEVPNQWADWNISKLEASLPSKLQLNLPKTKYIMEDTLPVEELGHTT